MESRDYLQYYDLESYLLNTVRAKFVVDRCLSAFDFFCIVIWKSNRAKTKIARRLLKISTCQNLDAAVKQLTGQLVQQNYAKERLHCLMGEWGFRLPMASAILTILYPDEFTVYDFRVCACLGKFHELETLSNFDSLWDGYQQFCQAVIDETPTGLTLRDKDRLLWAKSFVNQLEFDIQANFNQGESDE